MSSVFNHFDEEVTMARKPALHPRFDKSLPRDQRFSPDAIRQQQMAWMLFIAEGHLANLETTRRGNTFCLHSTDVELLDRQIVDLEKHVQKLRDSF